MNTCACGCGQTVSGITGKGVIKRYVWGHNARVDLASRFWPRVSKSDGGCWEWIGLRDQRGYGRIGVEGKMIGAHRAAYELTYGPVAPGLEVCHRCDNPPCVNPAHLFVGTHLDNIADMHAKGRWESPFKKLRGERNVNAKLTEAKVREIRAWRAAGGQYTPEAAARFGLSMSSLHRTATGQTWKHVS